MPVRGPDAWRAWADLVRPASLFTRKTITRRGLKRNRHSTLLDVTVLQIHMGFEERWNELRERCESLDPESILVTPRSDRAFVIDGTTDERINIRYREARGERPLWRDQFAVLDDRLSDSSDGIDLGELPTGVEPYVTVLSLAAEYTVDEATNELRRVTSGSDTDARGQSPFVRPEWEARTPQERVHDDALLLADVLERHPFDELPARDGDELVDVYVLLSDVQRGANRLRRRVGEELLDRIGPDDRLHGQFGTVTRTLRERRRLKDLETVFDVLDERGIPREWVVGVDQDKLDVVLTVTDLEESSVYDVEDQIYVQKTAVEEETKQSRLQGLAEQLETLESEEAEELQREIEQLETRLSDLLAAS